MTGIRRTALLAHPLPASSWVEVYRAELPPGQPAGPHFHPGAVTGYVDREAALPGAAHLSAAS